MCPEVQEPKRRETALTVAITDNQQKIMSMLPVFMREQSARFFEVALSASKNPQIAQCDPISVIESIIRAAQWGLVPDGTHGALVPYGKSCTFIPMYRGLISAYRRGGDIKQVWADLVFKGDEFEYEVGMSPKLRHVPKAKTRTNPDGVEYAYACARWADGHVDFVVMTIDELEFTRRKSRAQNGPWKTDTCAMYLKTPLRRLSKFLPLSAEIQQLVSEDEKQDSIDVEGEVVSGSTSVSSIDELLDARKSEKEEQSEQGFADEPQQSDEPAIRDIHGIPVDIKWEDVKDEEFGGGNKLLGHLTPAKLADLLGKDKEVTDAAKAVLKKGQAIYANGGTPPKPYRALALAFQQAENGAGF